VLVHAIHEVRHPADARLEEGDAQLRMPVSNTPPDTSAVMAVI
jgi:hypothetical protein